MGTADPVVGKVILLEDNAKKNESHDESQIVIGVHETHKKHNP